MYLRIPGRSFLILNSLDAAIEFLDKRSGIHSDRMRLILYEMMGWFPTLTFLPYGKRFQKHRRLLQEYLHQKQCLSYHPLQTQQARRLLVDFLDDPQHWMNHFQIFSTSFIIKITYGIDISKDDPYIDISNRGLSSLTSCGPVGNTPVDFLPFLRYFPSWFPGTYYAFRARSLRSAVRGMHEYLFEAVKQQLREGIAKPSYLSHYLDQFKGIITQSALSFFVLAMVLFPEFQKKAQQEIDRVVGKGRLPELSDRSSLPYVDAIQNEVLRWNTVLPSGVPHCSIDDDVYNGVFIPKGTVIIANSYAILRDESIYADPDSFNPSRYLPKPEGNAEPYPIGHFGFGRRLCPGQYIADASIWTAISSMLATLDIRRALDDKGNEMYLMLNFHPKPFLCTIKPRDQSSESMIRQAQLWDDG
ncbi:cytochrome P450 [Cyathus striatus]|nr:cytochrome P450 [Cyathus striatus]